MSFLQRFTELAYRRAKSGPAIVPSERATFPPLSSAQQRFLLESELSPTVLNMVVGERFVGEIDADTYERALNEVVARHELLRTRVGFERGTPVQSIEGALTVPLERVDLRSAGDDCEPALKAEIRERAERRFDLRQAPLLRATLFRVGAQEQLLLYVVHHLLLDGVGFGVFSGEVAERYWALAQGRQLIAPPVSVQYVDFARWEQERLRSGLLDETLATWKQLLEDAPAELKLPLDRPRRETTTKQGAVVRRDLSPETAARIQTFCRTHRVSPYVVLLAAYYAALFRWSGQGDVIVGSVSANRDHPSVRKMIGCFINFLPLRVQLDAELTATDLIERVGDVLLEAYANQDYPFELIVEAVNPDRVPGGNPLYNVAFVQQELRRQGLCTTDPRSVLRSADVNIENYQPPLMSVRLDLRVSATLLPTGTVLEWEYAVESFDCSTIEALAAFHLEVLEQIIAEPALQVGQLALPAALRAQVAHSRQILTPRTVAVTSTFTVDPIESSITLLTSELDLPTQVVLAPYDQVFQTLLDPQSVFGSNRDGLNVVVLRVEDWLGRQAQLDQLGEADLARLRRNGTELVEAVKRSAAQHRTPHLVLLCPSSPQLLARPLLAGAVLAVERTLAADLAATRSVEVVSSAALAAMYPIADSYNPKTDELGHLPYTEEMIAALGTLVARRAYLHRVPPHKVLALDCDGTLWKGVVGEEGPTGVTLDEGRAELQAFLVAQQEAGVLLCLCSKNNEADVWEVFERRPEMPLRKEHFVGWRIDWNPKSDNLRALAEELQLGLDSFVFLDDSPQEIAEVRARAPEVLALTVPTAGAELRRFLRETWAFDRRGTTDEDRRRTEMYQQNAARERVRGSTTSLEDFLTSLELHILIEPLAPASLTRSAQLTERTNQFNTTTHRRSEAELAAALSSGELEGLTVQVRDRFGDYGLTGLCLFGASGEALHVDSLMLSCRVLGKGVEHELLRHLGALAAARGLQTVALPYARTKKNAPALAFLESLGAKRQPATDGTLFLLTSAQATTARSTTEAAKPLAEPVAAAAPSTQPAQQAALLVRVTETLASPAQVLGRLRTSRRLHSGARQYVAPRTPLELQLAELWAELLRVERVGIDDDFFALGGQSLLAMRMIARLQSTLGVELSVRAVFEKPTIAALAGAARAAADSTLPKLEAGARPVLSFAQERFWVLDQLVESNAYNVPVLLRLRGALDEPALGRALDELARRHEALRARFPGDERGRPMLVVAPPGPVPLPLVDVTAQPAAERATAVRAALEQQLYARFDLATGPVMRALLVRVDRQEHLLSVTYHHIVSDGWSFFQILMPELTALYGAFAAGRPSPLPALPFSYSDYAAWQRQLAHSGGFDEDLAYWKDKLAGAPALLELPTKGPRPAVQRFEGAAVPLALGVELTAAVEALAAREHVTPFMVLLAAFQVLLSRYSGQRDVVVGTPIAGRTTVDSEGIVGPFLNTLALRAQLSGSLTVRALIEQVRQTTLDAYDHQALPFERVVDATTVTRSLAHSPLFQAIFVLQNFRLGIDSPPGLVVTYEPFEQRTTEVDLRLELFHANGTFEGSLRYATALFDEEMVRRLGEHFRALLAALVAAPIDAQVFALELLSVAERRQLLVGWNDTARPYAKEKLLHELVEAQVERTPELVAVEFDGARSTYRELNRRANHLAHRVIELGVPPRTFVAILLDRSDQMLVAVLGILKAGAAYVPLDPAWPTERLQLILSSMSVTCVVTQASQRVANAELFSGSPRSFDVVSLDDDLGHLSNENLPHRTTSEDLAYTIFTSGSTGVPKGVMVCHRAVVNTIEWVNRTFAVGPGDRLLFVSSLCFDLSVYDLFGILSAGGTVRVASSAETRDPEKLVNVLSQEEITFWDSAPAALQQLAPLFPRDGKQRALRLVFLSGDWIPVGLPDEIRTAFTGAQVISLGGATEAAIWSNYYPIAKVDPSWRSIPYGKPIQNARYHVLDEHLSPCPIGVGGDLYIGGDCLALGYANDPILTASKFIPDGRGDGRLYRTGDRARYFPDGNLEFLGRIDHQVKIRGFRIELGEIEAALLEQDGVREAVVLAREDVPGQKRLVAYVIGEGDSAALKLALGKRLPEYMVPSAFVVLEIMPVTSNGKLDRKALPAPEHQSSEHSYVAPRNASEQRLAELYAELLGRERIGVHDDFFELGGNSLTATQLAARVRNELELELPVRMFFDAPTVARLAAQLVDARRGGGPTLPKLQAGARPVLSFAQERFWLLDQLVEANAYNVPMLLRLRGALDETALGRALDELARRHEALRARFPGDERGRPMLVVAPPGPVPLPLVDVTAQPAAERATAVRAALEQQLYARFDLATGPVMRALLVRVDRQEHLLSVTYHHIVSDGWSFFQILMPELTALYGAFAAGRPSPLPALPFSYSDYAAWQRQLAHSGGFDEDLAYWKDKLAGAPALLELPTKGPRPAVQRFEGAAVPLALGVELTAAVEALAAREHVTPFMVLLAAFQVLLSRYSGQRDVVVGTPIAGRTIVDSEGIVGPFLNTLALRAQLSGSLTVRALIEQVRKTTLDAYDHQALPFERVVDATTVTHTRAHSPLYQAMFNLQNFRLGIDSPPGLVVTYEPFERRTTQVDFALELFEGDTELRGIIHYATALFDEEMVRRFADDYCRLVAALVAAPAGAPLSELGARTPKDELRREPPSGFLQRFTELAYRRAKSQPAIVRSQRPTLPPLSSAQQRFSLMAELSGDPTAANLTVTGRIIGRMDPEAYELALNEIVARCELLRTRVGFDGGTQVQIIEDALTIPLERVDLRSAGDAWEQVLATMAGERAGRGFDLQRTPLLRPTLFRVGPEDHVFLFVVHHFIIDAFGLALLFDELRERYVALAQGQRPIARATPVQYADFARFEMERLGDGSLDAALASWKQRLAGAPPELTMPLDRPRRETTTKRGNVVRRPLSPATIAQIPIFCRAHRVSPNVVLLAAYYAALFRWSGQGDVIVGSVSANRDHPSVRKMIGCFINFLPLRVRLDAELTATDLIERVGDVLLEAYANQDCPFEHIIAAVKPVRVPGGNPLYNLAFVQLPPPPTPWRGADLEFQSYSPPRVTTELDAPLIVQFDLSVNARLSSTKGHLDWFYPVDLFDRSTIEALAAFHVEVLEQIIADPALRLGQLALPAALHEQVTRSRGGPAASTDVVLSAAERRQLLVELNDTAVTYPQAGPIHEQIAAQARRTPNAEALRFDDEHLSYAELDARANQLAHHLAACGVGPDMLVGVCVERSVEMVVALLGILKAGAAYVPLDPSYPTDRLAYMLEDAAPALLLTQARLVAALPRHGAQVLCLDTDWHRVSAEPRTPLDITVRPHNLAYMIYTSGSTGRPKGAMNSHAGIANRLAWMQAEYHLDANDAVLQKTPFSFDVSVWEFFWPLMTGARLVVALPGAHQDPTYLADIIERSKITTVHFVPSMLAVFLAERELAPRCRSLRQIMCSGEALPYELQERCFGVLPAVALHNLYGPTEAAVDVTYWACERGGLRKSVPIGRPVANTKMYVLDGALQLVPRGIVGELFIAGVQLGRGYWRRPDLTADRFIVDPHADTPGARMYRTGDLARWSSDGVLEYLGRTDHQVKVRGFRIELGEIEAVLARCPGVREVVVLAREDAPGDKRIVAYVTGVTELATLDEALRRELPAYMVPSTIVPLGTFPLLPNGKLDRKALPAPERGSGAGSYVAPRTPLEQQLETIWRLLLRMERIGVNDDFFQIGGHSLLAMNAVARMREELRLEMTPRSLFQNPTIATLAIHLESLRAAGARSLPPIVSVDRSGDLPLSFSQESFRWAELHDPGLHLLFAQTTMCRLEGALDLDALERAFTELVRRNEALRTYFPMVGDHSVQRIAPAVPFSFVPLDLSSLNGDVLAETMRAQVTAMMRPFNLERGPLLRVLLVRTGPTDHSLVVTIHHINCDGWGNGLMHQQLRTLYDAYAAGLPSPLPEPAIQPGDFAVWQRRCFPDCEREDRLRYWREHLQGAPHQVDLPFDRPRVPGKREAAALNIKIDPALTTMVRVRSAEQGSTLATMLSAFAVALWTWTGQRDIVVGSVQTNRTRAEILDVVGCFINYLAFRVQLVPTETLTQVRERHLEEIHSAFDHDACPIEQIIKALKPEGGEIFNVAFHLHVARGRDVAPSAENGGVRFSMVAPPTGKYPARVDLALHAAMSESEIALSLQYDALRFDRATIEAFAQRYLRVLGRMLAEPELLLSALT